MINFPERKVQDGLPIHEAGAYGYFHLVEPTDAPNTKSERDKMTVDFPDKFIGLGNSVIGLRLERPGDYLCLGRLITQEGLTPIEGTVALSQGLFQLGIRWSSPTIPGAANERTFICLSLDAQTDLLKNTDSKYINDNGQMKSEDLRQALTDINYSEDPIDDGKFSSLWVAYGNLEDRRFLEDLYFRVLVINPKPREVN